MPSRHEGLRADHDDRRSRRLQSRTLDTTRTNTRGRMGTHAAASHISAAPCLTTFTLRHSARASTGRRSSTDGEGGCGLGAQSPASGNGGLGLELFDELSEWEALWGLLGKELLRRVAQARWVVAAALDLK